jgi:triphosphoribosyl-dephospho-CoA synthase
MVRRTLSTARQIQELVMTQAIASIKAAATAGLSSRQLASLAKDALIAEAELTPKPGLVDRRGSGTHTDLSLEIMRRSANTIELFFARMAAAATDSPIDGTLRAVLGAIGREAETAMLKATKGSNSHKGAIWILGLLVAGASSQLDVTATRVAECANQIARLPDHARIQPVSHGEAMCVRYGTTGARGEACAGFPHVVHVGLPGLAAARAYGLTEEQSRLHALLHIMASLDDTCVLYRGGAEGLQFVKKCARRVLEAGGPGCAAGEEAFSRFDRELSVKRISPGGSADLLAATLFLDALNEGRNKVQEDNSLPKETYGTHNL